MFSNVAAGRISKDSRDSYSVYVYDEAKDQHSFDPSQYGSGEGSSGAKLSSYTSEYRFSKLEHFSLTEGTLQLECFDYYPILRHVLHLHVLTLPFCSDRIPSIPV